MGARRHRGAGASLAEVAGALGLHRPEAPAHQDTPAPACPGAGAPGRSRLCVALPRELHRTARVWAEWKGLDLSELVAGFLADQVAGFEARQGPGPADRPGGPVGAPGTTRP